MKHFVIGITLLLMISVGFVADAVGQSATASMQIGGVYCISQAAIEEHLKATSEADVDRVRDILSVRRICDYAQAPVRVVPLASPSSARWLKVRIADDLAGPWRKGSKVTLPKDSVIYVRKNSVH